MAVVGICRIIQPVSDTDQFGSWVTINFRPLYVFDIGHLHILDYTSLDQETLLKNFDHLMNYLNNPFQTVLSLPDFPVSASGAHHFMK